MPDLIQTSSDNGESWTDHTCQGRAQIYWQVVGTGQVATMIAGVEIDPAVEVPKSKTLLVRIQRADGKLQPVYPIRAQVKHKTNNPKSDHPQEVTMFDARKVRQDFVQ